MQQRPRYPEPKSLVSSFILDPTVTTITISKLSALSHALIF